MEVKIVLNITSVNKEDVRAFVQMIREWELRTHSAQIDGVLFHTNPQITSAEAREIFEDIFPEFKHLVEIPASKAQLLRLGVRGIVVGGKLVGTCDELTLSIGEASDEEIRELQKAHVIGLVRIQKG